MKGYGLKGDFYSRFYFSSSIFVYLDQGLWRLLYFEDFGSLIFSKDVNVFLIHQTSQTRKILNGSNILSVNKYGMPCHHYKNNS